MAKIVIEITDVESATQAQGKVLGGADAHTRLQKLMTYLKSKLAGTGSDVAMTVKVVNELATVAISANTAANPSVVTATAHGLTSGDLVQISGSNSTPSLNGAHKVTVVDANSFSVPVNVSIAGTAGTLQKINITVPGPVVGQESSSI